MELPLGVVLYVTMAEVTVFNAAERFTAFIHT